MATFVIEANTYPFLASGLTHYFSVWGSLDRPWPSAWCWCSLWNGIGPFKCVHGGVNAHRGSDCKITFGGTGIFSLMLDVQLEVGSGWNCDILWQYKTQTCFSNWQDGNQSSQYLTTKIKATKGWLQCQCSSLMHLLCRVRKRGEGDILVQRRPSLPRGRHQPQLRRVRHRFIGSGKKNRFKTHVITGLHIKRCCVLLNRRGLGLNHAVAADLQNPKAIEVRETRVVTRSTTRNTTRKAR